MKRINIGTLIETRQLEMSANGPGQPKFVQIAQILAFGLRGIMTVIAVLKNKTGFEFKFLNHRGFKTHAHAIGDLIKIISFCFIQFELVAKINFPAPLVKKIRLNKSFRSGKCCKTATDIFA